MTCWHKKKTRWHSGKQCGCLVKFRDEIYLEMTPDFWAPVFWLTFVSKIQNLEIVFHDCRSSSHAWHTWMNVVWSHDVCFHVECDTKMLLWTEAVFVLKLFLKWKRRRVGDAAAPHKRKSFSRKSLILSWCFPTPGYQRLHFKRLQFSPLAPVLHNCLPIISAWLGYIKTGLTCWNAPKLFTCMFAWSPGETLIRLGWICLGKWGSGCWCSCRDDYHCSGRTLTPGWSTWPLVNTTHVSTG